MMTTTTMQKSGIDEMIAGEGESITIRTISRIWTEDYRDDDHSSVLECMGYSFSGHRNRRIDKITSSKLNEFVV